MKGFLPSLALLTLLLPATASAGAVDRLARSLLQNQNYKVRLRAARDLQRFKGRAKAVESLAVALGDPHPLVRGTAANSLAAMGASEALPKICRLLTDPDDFVQKAAKTALDVFGGAGSCEAKKVWVNFAVLGLEPAIQQKVTAGLRSSAQKDERILLEPDEGARGVELQVRVARRVNRAGGRITIECQMSQAIYDIQEKGRILRGSATQRGALELGASASEAAIATYFDACVDALMPHVFSGLSDYLARLQ